MDSKPYSLLDLIRNDNFITWVRRPSPQSDENWKEYLIKFPEQKATIELAKGYIDVIAEDTGRDVPTHARSHQIWQNVKNKIDSENAQN